MKKEREINYDLMRILVCFFVIILHVSASNIGLYVAPSYEWKVMNFYDSLSRCCVPIFFMLSGAFLLQKEIDITLLKKYISKYICIYFIWSFLYAIDTLSLKVAFTDLGLLVNTIFMSKYHLWFILSLIGIYFIQPILYKINKNKKLVKYYLLLFFIFCILKNTCLDLLDSTNFINQIFSKINIPLLDYVGYFILGNYLYNNKILNIKNRYLILIFILILLTSCSITYYYDLTNPYSFKLYNNFSLSVFSESIIIFIIFKNLKINKQKLQTTIKIFAPYTFGIYLIHIFILEQLQLKFDISSICINPLYAIPLVSILIFILSLFITMIVSKIPILKKIMQDSVE